MKAPNPNMPTIKMQSSKSGNVNKDDDDRKSTWRSKKESSDRKNNNNKKRERTIGELTLHKSNPKQKASVSNSSKGCHNDDNETDDLRCLFCFALESYDEDPILICDGCNQCTHMSCYNLSEIPSGMNAINYYYYNY